MDNKTESRKEKNMSEIKVEIKKLKPMRMISAYCFGKEPEGIAWNKLKEFAIGKGLYNVGNPPSTYGFNNPNPCHGSPNYGYEIWLPVESTVAPEGDLRVIEFTGGLYAVTKFKDLAKIGEVWGELVKWRETSKYRPGYHQWLEELLTNPDLPPEEYVFNLYLPITE
jgi:predicted transcriptional regulator YdeE